MFMFIFINKACPGIMTADLSRYFKGLVTTFVYRNDLVPSLSFGLFRDFKNITLSFSQEKGIAEDVIGKLLNGYTNQKKEDPPVSEPQDDLFYWALLKTLEADMKTEKLYPPGRVYWINGIEDHSEDPDCSPTIRQDVAHTKISLFEVQDVETVFSDIKFSTSMFTLAGNFPEVTFCF